MTRRFALLTTALLALGATLYGEATTAKKKGPAPAVAPHTVVRSPRSLSPRAVTSTTISEVLATNLTMQPGTSQQFFAKSDFTGVEQVSLAFYAAPDQDISATNYLVWWAIPDAPNYAVSDYLQGQDFAFLNSGGAVVATYGNQLMIEMRNNGTKPVTLSQITVYAVAH
jgi:hypothetical protein